MSNTTSSNNMMVDPSNIIKYIIMQICYIPSIICSIYTLINLLLNRRLLSTIHYHTPLILLIISIIDLLFSHPFTLNYLRTGFSLPSTNSMCISWNFFNALSATAIYWSMAWSSLERYLLVFYSLLFSSHRRKILFHYIPLIVITTIYPIISNIVIILIYPCTHQFNMLSLFCGYVCALRIPSVALFFRIAHNFVPISIVISSNLMLIIRFIKQKRQIQNNQFDFRKHRKMIIQLFILSSLFLILTLPSFIVGVIQNCCITNFASNLQISYFTLFIRFITILMPFMCFSSIPEIRSKFILCKNNQAHSIGTIKNRTNPRT